MKAFFLSLIPMALFAFGVFGLTRMVEFKPWTKPGQEEEYKEFKRIIAMPVVDKSSEKLPKVECLKQEFDFGVLPPFMQQSCEFVVKNVGNEALALKRGGDSCTCLSAEFSACLLEPGEEKAIPVTWNTDKSGKFAQFVKILTNSPETPELQLWVTGIVASTLQSSIQMIDHDEMLFGEERSQEFYLYSNLWDRMEIDRIECSGDFVQIERIDKPTPVEDPFRFLRKVEKPLEFKSRADFRVTVKANSTHGMESGTAKIFVRPPETPIVLDPSLTESAESARIALDAFVKQRLRPDGTMLVEIPISTRTVRKLSLYGPAIADGDERLIDLGKLRTTSPAQQWAIVAKIRGKEKPTDFRVSLTGIPGVTASVEPIERSGSMSYRIKIHAQEKLRLGLYNQAQAGKLTIESPGLTGEELHEFTVELDVLEET